MVNIRAQLIRDEGVRLKVYADTSGKLTIGCGRNVSDRGISHAEALYLLDNDIADFKKGIVDSLPWAGALDDARFGALINLAFNMGVEGLLEFKQMLSALRVGNWDKAAADLLDSDYAQQVGDRARRIAKQIQTGVWQ